jgi:hypothetical protein
MFLCGFDSERREMTYDGPNQDIGAHEASVFAQPVEGLLTEMLSIPLLTLTCAQPETWEFGRNLSSSTFVLPA